MTLTDEQMAAYQEVLDLSDYIESILADMGVEIPEDGTVFHRMNPKTGTYRMDIRADHLRLIVGQP